MTSFLGQSEGILIVFFSTKFQRARVCNYGIPRLSQNKMKGLYSVKRKNSAVLKPRPAVNRRIATIFSEHKNQS